MRFSKGSRQDRQLEVEITSMIDIVFLLIIFFMTTAQFARLTRAEVDLPREPGEQEKQPEEEGVVINVLADGEIIVAENTVTLDELEQLCRAEVRREVAARGDATGLKLLIRADRNADSRSLNAVVAMLQNNGIGAARLGTEVPQ